MKLKFKSKPEEAKKMVFGNKHKHVKPTRKIIPRSTSLFSPLSFNKPVKRYWGDYDGDGVINGLDCEPRNPKKQGPQHKKIKGSGVFSIGNRGEMVELSNERFGEDMREAGFADDEDLKCNKCGAKLNYKDPNSDLCDNCLKELYEND